MSSTIAERLLYTTVKVETFRSGNLTGTGTGFFFGFQLEGSRSAVFLVTNKHVVAGAEEVAAICHRNSGKRGPSGEHFKLTISVHGGGIIEHPDPSVDLCMIAFSSVLNETEAQGKPLYIEIVDPSIIPTDAEWENFDAVEDVMMIGCPRGIYDEVNNLPIVRRGITATSMGKFYNGKEQFLVDMACFPGSSGSPIFMNSVGYVDKSTNSYRLDARRVYFLGILFAGPQFTNHGEIVLATNPTFQVSTMMHLGYVIRSSALSPMIDVVRDIIAKRDAAEGR